MVCRYVLEYGEDSNTYNFTVLNVISYIAIIPTIVVVAYHFNAKHLTKRNQPD